MLTPTRDRGSLNAWAWAVAALAAAALLPTLSLNRLLDADELTHARVALEAARDGHWLPLTLEGRPWSDKPPLLLWACALLLRGLGPGEWVVRLLPCAGACLALGLFVRLLLRSGLGRVPALLLTLLLFANQDFLYHARFFSMDTWLLAAFLGAVSACAEGGWLRAGLWLALAAALKSWFAVALLPAALAALSTDPVLEGERRGAALKLVLPALAMLAAWLALYTWAYGAGFLAQEWGHNLAGRVSGQGHPSTAPPWEFYPAWTRLRFPVVAALGLPILVLAWAEVLRRGAGLRQRLTVLFLLSWGLGLLAVRTTVFHYLLPWGAFGLLALGLTWSRWRTRGGALLLGFGLAGAGFAASPGLDPRTYTLLFVAPGLGLCLLILWRPHPWLNRPAQGLSEILLALLCLQCLAQALPFYASPPDYNRPLVDAVLARPRAAGESLAVEARPTQALGFYTETPVRFLEPGETPRPGETRVYWTPSQSYGFEKIP